MAAFFIETTTGRVATLRQLAEAGVVSEGELPQRPWHRIQGSSDATTLWYAVLRKRVKKRGTGGPARLSEAGGRASSSERGTGGPAEDSIFIGSLAIRHQPHHAFLLRDGWEEVPVNEIGAGLG
jgi:hypothetical protein